MCNKELPVFTVIIPQKNRAEYLRSTLLTCMAQDYPNFEIIVSDDCSEDNSVRVVEDLMKRDSRIRLFAHSHHLGMRDNFEFALSQVKPGYVIALGGDDGLIPGGVWRMYEILSQTGKELLTWIPASFCYPTQDSAGHNILLVRRKKTKKVKILKSKDFLQKISKTFRYQIDECPMFYIKGVVSTELVERVKNRTADHSFYYCPTPDGFSGVVLAGEVEEYAFTNEPLSIGGTTIKSQGQNYRRSDKQSRAEAEQFFNDSIRRTMHRDLASQPYSPLVTLMTADYLLTAADLPGWPGKCYEISFENLLIQTFKLLEKGYFEDSVLYRELNILREIAKQHNLLLLYDELMHKTKRRVVKKTNIYGAAISHSYRFDGSKIGISNIFEASQAVNFISNIGEKLSIGSFFKIFINSVKIVIRSRAYKVEKLPQINRD